MQISSLHGHTVERVLRDHEGRLVRATFYVYQVGTRVRARLLTSEFVDEVKQIAAKVFALPSFSPLKAPIKGNKTSFATISPFYTVDQLYFSGSKPRAPTF